MILIKERIRDIIEIANCEQITRILNNDADWVPSSKKTTAVQASRYIYMLRNHYNQVSFCELYKKCADCPGCAVVNMINMIYYYRDISVSKNTRQLIILLEYLRAVCLGTATTFNNADGINLD